MGTAGRKGVFPPMGGSSPPTSIDIDINGASYDTGVTTNIDIPALNENDDPLGVNDYPVWRIVNIDLTQPNGDVESNFAGINLSCTAINALANSDLISQLTDAQVAAVFAGRVTTNIVEYTAGATYTKPSNLLFARVVCVGAGSGGGSGRRGATGSNRGGGAGGAAGALTSRYMLAAAIGSSETVTIGTGGTGGAAQTTNDTSGNNGGVGGDTSFGSLVVAKGGQAASGGSNGGVGGASGGNPLSCTPNVFPLSTTGASGGDGRHATATSNNATSTGFQVFAGCGGGGGGGMNTSDTEIGGGTGGREYDASGALNTAAAGGTAPGGAGTAGSDNYSLQIIGEYPVVPSNTKGMGTGGGGGAGRNAGGVGGAGANGGLYGAGGGGGGGSSNGNNSGAGGNGANGLCIVVEYLC